MDRFKYPKNALSQVKTGLILALGFLAVGLGVIAHWSLGAVAALTTLYLFVFVLSRKERANKRELLTVLNGQGEISLNYMISGSDRIFGWSPTEQVFVYLQKGYEIERIAPMRIGRIETCIFGINEIIPFGESEGKFFDPNGIEIAEYDLDWENLGIRIFDAFADVEIARFFCESREQFFTWLGILREECPHLNL